MAVIELTTQNFNEEVLQSDVPVMVDFWHHGAVHAAWFLQLWMKLQKKYKVQQSRQGKM